MNVAPQRILMTADPVGGVWTYALELMRALPDVEFALCTMGAPLTASQQTEIAALPNASFFSSSYRLEWMDEPWADVDRAGDWLLEIAADFQPDLIHLNGYAHAILPWEVPVIVMAHSCVLSWWQAVQHQSAPARFDEYRARVAAGLQRAALVIAPSRAMLNSLRRNYRAHFAGRVIYNARDLARFAPGIKQEQILAAGRVWDEAKNLAVLDRIAAELPWPIAVAGDTSRPDIEASTHPVEASTHPNAGKLGRLSAPELAAQLARSAIFVAPARYEPFGLSIVEAALSGCALVLGDIPSLRELWDESALFVAPDDHAGLARMLQQLIRDDHLCADFSQRAYRRAHDFSPQAMAQEYRAAYRACRARQRCQVAA